MRYDDAVEALVGLAASRHNAFHTTEAAEINISPQRLRRAELAGDLRRLHPKVWALNALPDSARQTLRAAVLSIPGSAATLSSAAWLHGWLTDPPLPPQLWVPSSHTRNHPVAELRRSHRIQPARDITVNEHIPALNKAATLCLLGSHVDATTLERCLDEFLRSDSVRWLDETAERLRSSRAAGVSALERLRTHPARVAGVSESWMERVVARCIAIPWLPPIELQHKVWVGDHRYRIDLGCPQLMLGVEAHSRTFHWGAGTEDADNVRDLELATAGWKLLYVTWSQLRRPDDFVRSFAAAARMRAGQLGVELEAA